ncbi:GNAT family N-acetyltransferase [Testudinibacter sp. TR-2022]|uniref:GNAT family N-acetyltransferase n=2 Tax=Testudinibacter sp. TR-2022 TaxID=2585029 RepID=UPI0011184341|nr:GNAT family N-acetyltransferase [Testudinibacter sp. TR-2022]TNH04797.1 GNAT family N-acetyltransferase [Pasteurellaceae bacterium Phil31]TNH06120.1 GNAT family N-acetyltransferase [Testudinibacter sp. TR-2022]TNH11530.1 GNAT family N-acetyltransferase [Testudinibacter sp. TR-2022]
MLTFRQATIADIDRCFEIESTAYASDEAASREKIALRIAQYPDGFLLIETGNRIIGFINSGCAENVVMSDEQFKQLIGHDPAAPNVVIMSVVVDPHYQGRGYSVRLMQQFIELMRCRRKQAIYLMCKAEYIRFYEKFGYRYLKPSAFKHGGISWYEMLLAL